MPDTRRKRKTRSSRVLVVGASAGGFEALGNLAAQLPEAFPAPVFMVLHVAPDFDGEVFVRMVRKRSALECKLAQDGEHFRSGVIYLAPPDVNMLVKEQIIFVTRGARETEIHIGRLREILGTGRHRSDEDAPPGRKKRSA